MPTDQLQGGPGSTNHAPPPNTGDPAPYDGRDAAARTREPAPRADTTSKVVLGGQEYVVPSDVATALRRERDRIAGEYGSRLQQYERRLAAVEAENEPEPESRNELSPPDPSLLDPASDKYDPARYSRENVAWTNHLVESTAYALERRRADEQHQAQALSDQATRWDRQVNQFYLDHPELRGKEDVVDAMWRKHFTELKDLAPAEGFAELASRTKERIVQLSEAGKQISGRRQPVLESSASARAVSQREVEEESNEPQVGGVSKLLRAKQARFRSPNFKAA